MEDNELRIKAVELALGLSGKTVDITTVNAMVSDAKVIYDFIAGRSEPKVP